LQHAIKRLSQNVQHFLAWWSLLFVWQKHAKHAKIHQWRREQFHDVHRRIQL